MPNTSALKVRTLFLTGLFFALFVFPLPGRAETEFDSGSLQEFSRPLIDPAEADQNQKPDPDPFFSKMRLERAKFFSKQQARKAKFINSLRDKDMTPEERQKKIADFWRKERKRLEKFSSKQNEKIQKHNLKMQEE